MLTLFCMVALIQSKNHAANKGKTADIVKRQIILVCCLNCSSTQSQILAEFVGVKSKGPLGNGNCIIHICSSFLKNPWRQSKIMKTGYTNLILSLNFTCRNQLQQTLHVCRFRQVCACSNLLSLVITHLLTLIPPI